MWWSGLDPPQKKIIFCPQSDKFGCFLTQFLTGRKHGQSLEALGHGFYGLIAIETKLTKTVQKLSKIHSQTKGGRGAVASSSPPEYATVQNDCYGRLVSKQV